MEKFLVKNICFQVIQINVYSLSQHSYHTSYLNVDWRRVFVKICIKTNIAPHFLTVQIQIFSVKFPVPRTPNKMKIVVFFCVALLLNNAQGQPSTLASQVASYLYNNVAFVQTLTTYTYTWTFTPTSTQLQCFDNQGVTESFLLTLINNLGPLLKSEFNYLCKNVIQATGCSLIGVTYGKTGSTYKVQLTKIPAKVHDGITIAKLAGVLDSSPTLANFVQQYGADAVIGALSCFNW